MKENEEPMKKAPYFCIVITTRTWEQPTDYVDLMTIKRCCI